MSAPLLRPEDLMRYAPAYVARRLVGQPAPVASSFSDEWIAAALFADISGFTPLSERMAAKGADGAEELSQILNAYFGTLIDCIDAHGADIARFAGDAVLAYWPLTSEDGLRDACQLAAQCAIQIQERMHAFQTPAGEKLSLRAGIGAGKIFTISLGGVRDRYECVVTGPGMIEASKAAAATKPGTVASGKLAWSLVGPDADGEPIDEEYIRVDALRRRVEPKPFAWPVLGPEAVPALSAYVPASIRRRMEVHQTAWLAELRRISVIFVNLPSLTHEAPLDIAQASVEAMQTELYRYEGSLNKLGADEKGAAFVAALGLPPLSHEDDELRAALAGFAIYQRLKKLGIEVSVGVHSGMAFCGTIGNQIRCEYSVLGDTVNSTARLMAAAHGGILCSESIYKKAVTKLEWEVLAPIKVKGKAHLVPIFKPVAVSGKAASTRPVLPMVGREVERRRIREAFTRLRDAGQGGTLVIEGLAGIGKSRMVTSTVEAAGELGLRLRSGFAEAVQRTTPYYAFRPVFHQLFELDRAAGDRVAQREAVLRELSYDPELVMLAPLLEVVLALDFQDNGITSTLFGEGRVHRTNEVLVRLMARAAAAHPTVLILEDCHWMDSASWALAAQLSREVQALTIVLATRPLEDAVMQRYSLLEAGPRLTRIVLEPLSPEHTLELVKQRLAVDELPAPVSEVLRTRAQGNPFFTEEVAFALVASGQIKVSGRRCQLAAGFDPQTVNLPDTVQGVVISRIDRLDPREQLTLKVASVVGRTFPYDIVHDVCPIDEDRVEQLPILKLLTDHQFVDLDSGEPQRVYSFHHVITQEVAYQLMMPAQRRLLHRSVAEWYERNCADLTPFYPLLAKHWTNTDQVAKALEYLEKSGQNALRDHANQEAVEFFTQALSLDRAAGRPSTPLRRGTWERMLAEATYNLGQLNVALEHYDQALQLLGHPFPRTTVGFVFAAVWQMALQFIHRLMPSRFFDTAGDDAPRALEASRAYERLVQVRYLNNAKVETIHAAFAGLNIAETVGDTPELARNHSTAAVMTGLLMMHGSARRYAERAQRVADKVQHKPTSAYVAFIRGVYWVTVGDWDLAEHDLALGAKMMHEMGDRRHWAETAFTLANALSRKGELERSLALSAELAAAGKQRGVTQVEVWGLSWQLWCLLAVEPESPELAHLEAALSTVLETRADVPLADQILGFGMVSAARWILGDPLRAVMAARAAEKIIKETSQVSHYLLCAYSCMLRVYYEQWNATDDPLLRDELEALAASLCTTMRDYTLMYPIGKPRLALARGRLEGMRGHTDRAVKQWRKSLAEAERLNMPYEQAQAHDMLALHAAPSERRTHEVRAAGLYAKWRRRPVALAATPR